MPLAPNFLHLDCALGLIREGLLVACPAALVDGLPVALLGREQIEVSETDGIHLGTNGLPIRPDAYVTDPAFRHIGDRIAGHDVTVEVRRLRNLPQLRRIVPVQHPVALAGVIIRPTRRSRRCAGRDRPDPSRRQQ